MKQRIKKLRKALELTQQQFAEIIGGKRGTVAKYETGANVPSAAVFSLICKTFNVNEEWLRTGQGEMFIQKNRSDEISEFIGEIMSGEPDFRQRFIAVLARMSKDEWKMLEQKVLELSTEIRLKDNNNKETDKPTLQMTVEEAEAEYIKSRSKFAQNTASNALNTFNDTLEDKKKTQKAG